MNKKLEHLKLIENVIERMDRNSFMLKGWVVTLLTGVLVLAVKVHLISYFAITGIPIVMFWGLDSYYLLQERKYRALYELVRAKNENDIDFNMTPVQNKNTQTLKYIDTLFSVSEGTFYGPLLIALIALIFCY